VGLHFNKKPFPPRRRHGVLRSRKVHITRRKHHFVGGMNDSFHPYILTSIGLQMSAMKKKSSPLSFSALCLFTGSKKRRNAHGA